MILQRREDEEEDAQQQGAPGAASYAPAAAGLAPAPTAAPSFPALRRFVSQGDLQAANAATLERQRSQAESTISRAGEKARAASQGVKAPYVPGDKLSTADMAGMLGRGGTHSPGPRAPARYEGPAKVEDVGGYRSAVEAIRSWQAVPDDAGAAGVRGDSYNEGLLGIGDNGYGAGFSRVRQSFADVSPDWARKDATVRDAVARGAARNDVVGGIVTPEKLEPKREPVALPALNTGTAISTIDSKKDVEAFADSVSNVMFTPFKSEADARRIYGALDKDTRARWQAMTPAERADVVSETAKKLGVKLNGDW